MLPLAAAAVLVAAIAATLTWRRDQAPPSQAPVATAAAPIDHATATSAELLGSVEAEFQQAEKHLESAVAGLEVLARDRQALDPKVAADLQKSLLVVDQAIGESRAALKTQPMSTRRRTASLKRSDRRSSCCRTPSRSSTKSARATRPKRPGLPMA